MSGFTLAPDTQCSWSWAARVSNHFSLRGCGRIWHKHPTQCPAQRKPVAMGTETGAWGPCVLPGDLRSICSFALWENWHLTPPASQRELGKWKSLSRVRLFSTPRTVQSMEFSRPEYWSGLPCPAPGDLPNPGVNLRSPTLQADSLPTEPQGKPKNTGVGSLSFPQQIFLTQELNRDLLHCR